MHVAGKQETKHMTHSATADGGPPPFDPQRRYVRMTRLRTDGFVEFQFAVGDPELCVDLILPADAYRDFQRATGAVDVTPVAVAPTTDPPAEAQQRNDNP